MKTLKSIIIIFLIFATVEGFGFNNPPGGGNGSSFAGTESTTGSAGSLKSPATTGVTTITGPGAGTTRNLTIPNADTTLGTAASATLGTGAGQVPITGDYLPIAGTAADSSKLENHAASYFQTALTNPIVRADLVDNATSTSTTAPPTANQVKVLKDLHDALPVRNATSGNILKLVCAGDPLVCTVENDVRFMIAGSSLTEGRAYYINTSGALTAADASSAATLPSPAVCVALSATECWKAGKWTTTGLTAGSVYYVPANTGGAALTTIAPSTAGNQVQRIGVASSTTVLEIMPSLNVAEIATP